MPTKLTKRQEQDIKLLLEAGYKPPQIAFSLGLSPTVVYARTQPIRSGKLTTAHTQHLLNGWRVLH